MIFISYSSRDGKAYAEEMYDRLMTAGILAFRDTNTLPKGEGWFHALEQAIANSDGMVVILTPQSFERHMVTFEWSAAKALGKPLFPLLYGGEVPDGHPFEHIQIDMGFNSGDEPQWDDLIEKINSITSVPLEVENAERAALRSYKSEEQIAAIEFLKTFGDGDPDSNEFTAAKDALARICESRSPKVSVRAAWSLGRKAKDPRAIPALMRGIERDDGGIGNRDLIPVLGDIGTDEAVEGLIALFSESTNIDRQEIAKALGRSQHSSAVPFLSDIMHTQGNDSQVHDAAIQGLGQHGSDAAEAVLLEGLTVNFVHKFSQNKSIWVMRQFRPGASPTVLDKLKYITLDDQHGQMRRAAAEAIATIGGQAALEILEHAQRHNRQNHFDDLIRQVRQKL